MPPPDPKPPSKGRQRLLVGGLLLLVLAGGAASFLFNAGGPEEEEEEIVIVDLSLPPPPPPPPPPVQEEDLSEPEESMDDAPEISNADTPDLSGEPTTDIDLGIDAGDLGSGPGGAFTVSIPRFSRRGGGGDGSESMMDGMDSPPTPVSKLQPNYPSSLLSKGIGGRVIVVCVVDEKGQVVSTSIRQSTGHPDLDKAAIAAVTKWKFKPATKGGRPTRASCTVPFTFEVKKN
ncbi:MAG: energy transducer TonB [Akkermansiaceae bacterium]|nr:energy transducer TonB [Akkermansiaceae bacterium]